VDSVGIDKTIKGLAVGVYGLARIATGENDMRKTGMVVLAALLALAVAGCAPLVVGGAVAVVADEAIEQDKGGDGLF
jgi:hypothetical protein